MSWARDKEKNLSPWRESNQWLSVPYTSWLHYPDWGSRRLEGSLIIFTTFVVTHILHTPTCMISNVEGVLWVDKERRIGNFKLGYKKERCNIYYVTSVVQWINLNRRRGSKTWPSAHRLDVSLTTYLLGDSRRADSYYHVRGDKRPA